MKQGLNMFVLWFLLGLVASLSGCSSVKELTNVDLTNMKIWPFGSSADTPRVYHPVNSVPYLCEGNKKFFVRMLDKGASAWLILPEREVLLTQSGTSKVYTNGISKLDLTTDDVSLDVNETTKYVACKANGVAKVTKVEPTAAVEPIIVPAPVVVTPPTVKQETQPAVAPAPEPKVEALAKPAEGPVAANENVNEESVVAQKSNDQEAVTKALYAWANAWRTKNSDVYLSAYSAKFKPEGMSQKAWIVQRKQRVGGNSGEINLVLDKVNVEADANKAEVTFIQHYTSGKFSDTVAKVLNFENENGHWFIIKESSQSKK